MTDEPKKDKLTISSPNKLQLTKTVDAGKVKQKFTHGREKAVTVEVRTRRTFTAGAGGAMTEVKRPGEAAAAGEFVGRGLTEGERIARMNALKSAEDAARQRAETIAMRKAEPAAEELVAVPEIEEITEPEPQAAAPQATAPQTVTTSAPRRRDDGITLAPVKPQRPNVVTAPVKPPRQFDAPAPVEAKPEREDANKSGKLKLNKRGDDRRNSGKITITQALGGYEERVRSLASVRRQREKALKKGSGLGTEQEKIIREVTIPEAITVQELANRMAVRAVDVIKVLMKLGMMVTVTQSIDADTAELVVTEFGHKFKRVAESDVENILNEEGAEAEENLKPRPPVVTIMGHVDHGKTSLLDALRKTDVVAKEAGGITQHIGAYQVDLGNGQKVTFLDTPGHEAFTAMRARGAKVTDIVVLVVAADDGIMAQTQEAIAHAKAAGVPIIVAINKIDKPEADVQRVSSELMQYELVPEEFGGDVMTVGVSAKQGTNLDKLVEGILLQAEVLELKANPDRAASGAIVEAKLDTGRGVVATLLIQKGTLKTGDIVVAGAASGRVRSITDDKGKPIKEAGPGMPVEIQGLSMAPEAGDVFSVVDSEKTAREIAEYREKRGREANQALAVRSMDQLFSERDGRKQLAVIVKADVQGSAEAIAASIQKFNSDEVSVKLLHSGVGAISESDIQLSKASNAMIVAFNVRASAKAKEMAAREKTDIRYYSVIYNVVDDIKAALSGLLSPTKRENFIGYAEIREVFNMSKAGKVAGCMVTEGMVKRGAGVRLLRDGVVIHQGTLKTLKRFKDEVKEVKSGFECGMAFENYEDIRQGDLIEAFEVVEEARTV